MTVYDDPMLRPDHTRDPESRVRGGKQGADRSIEAQAARLQAVRDHITAHPLMQLYGHMYTEADDE